MALATSTEIDLPSTADSVEITSTRPRGRKLALLAIAALGIVYGDIGTSPLYSLSTCFRGPHSVVANEANVFGVLSLIFWALTIIISLKYMVFILRADNRGEGGILALAALVSPPQWSPHESRRLVAVLGLIGAALLYADGMITPAISVLSAIEGLEIAEPSVGPYVPAIAVVILIGLFFMQSRGTARVGMFFGPVLLLWFLTIAILGASHIIDAPRVLGAINPAHALAFFQLNGLLGFLVLGTVFLVVTGGEALYADLGHFGALPIRITWFCIALPSLLICYFGQAALLLSDPSSTVHPFYRLAPSWGLYPLVALATAAAVIASQAIITGAFSLTLQAIQLGYCPRLTIRRTSKEEKGQIYVPAVNWALMLACIGLVVGFGSSVRLAAAYGLAIVTTMVITSALFFVLVKNRWKWRLPLALAVSGLFLAVDLSFFGANLTKIAHGGWFPLVVAGVLFVLMSTWREGLVWMGERLKHSSMSTELFVAQALIDLPARVPGTAVYVTRHPFGTPAALRHNVAHNKVIHETVVILSVQTSEVPRMPHGERLVTEEIGEGFYRVLLTYGFMDEPNVPRELNRLRRPRIALTDTEVSYFVGHERLVAAKRSSMAAWRQKLFAAMSRNAQSAAEYFRLPPEQVIEIGVQIEV